MMMWQRFCSRNLQVKYFRPFVEKQIISPIRMSRKKRISLCRGDLQVSRIEAFRPQQNGRMKAEGYMMMWQMML